MAPDDGSFLLGAVDPSNPDRILAYIDRDASGEKADPVLVSLDGGQSFEPYAEVTDFGGVAITTDGRVFIADRGSLLPDKPEGLWAADSLEDAPAELVTDRPFSCLGYQAETDALFGCELRAFGKLDQDSGAFTTLMEFDEVQSMVECEGVNMAQACQVQLCRDYCLLGHFPNTPLCEVYQSPTCGPCSDSPPGPGCQMGAAGSGAAGTSGTSAGTGGRGAMDAGRSGGGAGNGAAGMMGKPGVEPEPDAGEKKKDDGGCAVTEPGSSTHAAHALWALGGLGLVALARGRRRRMR